MTNHSILAWLAAFGASLVAACGADLIGAGNASVTGYEAASLFGPTGHTVSQLPDGRIRVTATGSAATSKARVEKIALARAAEYGAESGHKFFRAELPQHSIKCGKRERIERGEKIKIAPRGYSVVDLDVIYANDLADVTFKPTKDTADSLKAEILSEPAVPDEQAKAAVDAQCGT